MAPACRRRGKRLRSRYRFRWPGHQIIQGNIVTRKVFAAGLLLASSLSSALAAPPVGQNINMMSTGDLPKNGFTRLRVSLATSEKSEGATVRLAGISVCSESACYVAGAPGSVSVIDTQRGLASSVADLEIPCSKIRSITFAYSSGPDVLDGTVMLPEELDLEQEFLAGEILVLIQKSTRRSQRHFVPVSAAANYLPREGRSIHYSPELSTSVTLPLGVHLAIPARAYDKPLILITMTHDTGDRFPLLDIFPVVRLSRPIVVNLDAISRAAKSQTSAQPDATPGIAPASPGGRASANINSPAAVATPARATIEIQSTGVIHVIDAGTRVLF